MRNRKEFVLVALLLILTAVSSVNAQDVIGARPLGMGRAFVAIADDGNATEWNPAGMPFMNERVLSLSFTRYYMGISDQDALGEGALGYIYHFKKLGSVGVNYNLFFSNLWREHRGVLAYSHMIPGLFEEAQLAVGLNVKVLYQQVVSSNIQYTAQPGDGAIGIVDPRTDPAVNGDPSKFGVTGDFAAMLKLNQQWSFGLQVASLNQPDMSFDSKIPEIGKEPLVGKVGVAYRYQDWLIPTIDLRFINRKINDANQFKVHAGVEAWFMQNTMAFRGGYNPEEFALGFSYRMKQSFDLQVDYAFVYYLSDVADAGATTHRVSLTMRFLPPPEPLKDLALYSEDMKVYPRNAIVNEPVTISAVIKNLGEADVKGFTVSLYYQDAAKGWTQITPPTEVDRLDTGEEKSLTWKWLPPGKGNYQVFAAVDDNAMAIPEITGNVEESNEENNKGMTVVDVFPLPSGNVKPKELTLEVSSVTLVQEEEPIIPLVFFDSNKSEVDKRFERMLETVAHRLAQSPDVHLDVLGYYNTKSDSTGPGFNGPALASARAKAIRDVLVKYEPGISGKLNVMESGYDQAELRAGQDSTNVLPKDVLAIESENRRAKLRAVIPAFETLPLRAINFPLNGTEISKEDRDRIAGATESYKGLLNRNPEMILMLEGYSKKGETDSDNLAFYRALSLKKEILKNLGKNYDRRLFVKSNTVQQVEVPRADIFPSGEGLIYRPIDGIRAAKDFEVDDNQNNFIRLNADVEAGVDNWKVNILDGEGNVFKTLASGTGDIPNGSPWNWRDDNGNLIDPDKAYFAKLEGQDKLGQKFTAMSDTLKINVTKVKKSIEDLIIVQFNFDEDVSESKFLESRVEYVARKFVEKALEPKDHLIATIGGHTDVIGLAPRNQALSAERAAREENNLRRYLLYILGLTSNDELNAWLREHNTVLKSAGYAFDKPYIIDKWENNQFKQLEIGNNQLPEGRTINRRVIIEFDMKRSGDAKTKKVGPQSSR